MLRLKKYTKLSLLALQLAAVAVWLPLGTAQAEAPARVAVVNIQLVVKNANAAKTALTEIQKKRDAYQNDINKKEEALKKQDTELSKQKSLLSAEAFETKRQEFKKQVVSVQKDVQVKRQELDKAYTQVLSQIQSSVLQIVADLSKEKGFDIAVPASQVLYAEKTLDISDEVLTRLNKKLPKVPLQLKN